MTQNIIAYATEQLEAQVLGALQFNTDLVAANQSRLLSSIAVERDMQAWRVELADLKIIPDFNVRIKNAEYEAHIESLTQSILENGYYNDKPIAGYLGRDGKKIVIFVTDGHCRIEAVKRAIARGAPIKDLPLALKDKSTTIEDLTVALARSNDGKKLSPLELAIVAKRLAGFGWTQETIAQRIGITTEYVGQLLTIAGAPLTIRSMIEAGEASMGTALGALRAHGTEAAAVMQDALKAAKEQGKTKLTAKFMPEQFHKRAVTKHAGSLYDAIEKVKADAGFAQLTPEAQQTITAVLNEIIKAKAKSESKPKSTTEPGQANDEPQSNGQTQSLLEQ